MVELITNNGILDFENLQNLQYNMQVSDIFNLSEVKCSYLNSLTIPKTAHNIQMFEGLGLVGDKSRVPYGKLDVQMKYYGHSIINSGWLTISETSDTYKISIIDGMIDFFKIIEGRKIGTDLDLSESNHDKNIESVINSQNSNIYRYILADYGGKVFTDDEKLNIDYLTPSLGVKYLLSKIELFTGYKFIGSILDNTDVTELFLTYPKPPKETGGEISDLYFQGDRVGLWVNDEPRESYNADIGGNGIPTGSKIYLNSGYTGSDTNVALDRMQFRLTTVSQGQYQERIYNENYFGRQIRYKDAVYIVPTNGAYKLDLTYQAKVSARYGTQFQEYYDAPTVEIEVNGTAIDTFQAGIDAEVNYLVYRNLNAGDEVRIRYYFISSRPYGLVKFIFNTAQFKISNTDLGNVDFSDALKDMTITEFFKEFLWRYGLTTIANNKDKTIYLQTMNERILSSNAVDWSYRFIKRTSETYNVPTFGQNSLFVHKYNEEDKDYNDGSIQLSNTLLDNKKVIINSKIYSAEQGLTDFPDVGQKLPILPIWTKEVKANSQNVIEINYKALSSRFYFQKSITVVADTPLEIKSEVLNENGEMSYYNYSNVTDVHFNSLVPKYYKKHQLFLNDFKAHSISVKMSIFDLINVDLSKIYYFEAEKQYYILNKLTWSSDGGKQGTIKGEFVRVII